ncbi:alpha/beta hydrolase family protein [Cryptosporangium sp. NPDC048952]|uniref:alpha/beta hydrolase family protein n=1 Tax=Cryptosporangium sp. NPDC048952 TaxID=3363961 RepID=UPI00371BA714
MLPKNKLLALLLLIVVVLIPLPAAAADTDVHYGALNGTVITPPTPGRHPAVVLVAGAGPTQRDAYRAEAEAFARAGIVTLIYDKRAGYSRATTSFSDLADDALAGVRMLRARPDVDPERVGLWGHSQGGWVVPLAATRSSDVKFVVVVAAGGHRPDRSQLWSNRVYLEHAGVESRLIRPIGENLSRMMIDAGLFGDTENDPVAVLERVDQPVLGVWGALDRSVVPGESLTIYQRALDRGRHAGYSLRVVPGADHSLRSTPDGFVDEGTFAPGYLEMVTSWITGARTPTIDAAPAQPVASQPVRALSWYENPALHLVALGLMLVAFLAFPVGAVVRRIRGRKSSGWAPRLCVAAGLAAVLGTAAYVFSIVVTGSTAIGGVVLGRPVPWLILQLLAVGVVAAGIATAVSWPRAGSKARLVAPLIGTAVFLPWAFYWGLFTL